MIQDAILIGVVLLAAVSTGLATAKIVNRGSKENRARRRSRLLAMWSKKDLERLYHKAKGLDLTLGYHMQVGWFYPSMPKHIMKHVVPYLQPDEDQALYGPYHRIPKMLNHEDLTVRVIAAWRLEMGR